MGRGKQAGERNLTILPSNNVYFFFLPDLKAFIQFVTGSPVALRRVLHLMIAWTHRHSRQIRVEGN